MNIKVLRVAAAVEAASILILFVNLFTIHAKAITSLGGPTHGTAYLITIVSTFSLTVAGAAGAARGLAFVPGVGGMLVLNWLRRHPEAVKAPAKDPVG
ncbi:MULTISPECIES: DUF3817 domain-containing protein [Streptomyces]|jgi:hypothetical protein|uniref:DUF3817 domain-containing protein n=3 Tax=Streptomyces TaxID=1883 RepID=A0A1D8G1X2_9ACTN|nr:MULTISPECIES: hypothetical protein [Streptomyces]AOT59457.1 hypothetical protein A4G23_02299 [Streptomyces rubrolavendulae]OSY48770.1 hypothetical protein BG846_05645 [Streptomyces fradiae ATCC 10745 = DSM 40063]UQS32660.1 hypothetical protein J5J01_10895 [Streptomyces fradiae]